MAQIDASHKIKCQIEAKSKREELLLIAFGGALLVNLIGHQKWS